MERKEWTLMFYMASDNPLAISIISQLKALKAAGYHDDVNVVAQFDPYTEGTPTHVFDVNLINKLKAKAKNKKPTNIGFTGNESFVRNLIEDRLWRGEQTRTGKTTIREALDKVMRENHKVPYLTLAPEAPDLSANGTNGNNTQPDQPAAAAHGSQNGHHENGRRREPGPYHSLLNFLTFCSATYPAKHYMLFIVGHGVVVGNDIFLFDAHAEDPSITLSNLGKALLKFKESIDKESSFDLVSFHSCSVSSLEVAYELKGIANYMLASQGPAFVGSWPYREILIRIFREVEQKRDNIRELISDIYHYCLHNSSDYLLGGYSFQLTLCDLSRVSDLDEPMQRLSAAMVKALSPENKTKNDAASTFVILYAHWKAQSFFEEMYTDLYDFCYCIVDRCERIASTEELPEPLKVIRTACADVLGILAKSEVINGKPTASRSGRISDTPKVVTASDYVGPTYQYSRGLSIYFPWTRPSDDSEIMQGYETYKFHQEFNERDPQGTWFAFLKAYFIATERETKRAEIDFEVERQMLRAGVPQMEIDLKFALAAKSPEHEYQELQEDIGNLIYCGEGPLGGFALAGPKTDPFDKTGGDCNCASFKNFPRDTRSRRERRRQAQKMPVSDTLLGDFFTSAE
jgi:hypothetical protein